MRSRILSFDLVDPKDLTDHPQNWREHPSNQQAALREVFERIGIVDVILAYQSPGTGKLTVVDGHLRKKLLSGEAKVPVIKLDLTDDEANAILASHDPIAAMAIRNDDLFTQIVSELETNDDFAQIARMLDTDKWKSPEEEEADELFNQSGPAAYEIVPVYDEGYDAVIITAATDSEWGQLRTLLNLPEKKDRRGKVGTSRVLTFEEFAARWKSR